jgi:DNA (cytosine-5)-methyltransferase 1
MSADAPFTVAEFFAGVGLVRKALESEGLFRVSFANDIEPKKQRLYERNFGKSDDFKLGDIRQLHGADVPSVDLATASFPCTDLSLAGNRRGLKGEQSGAFHEFARIIKEMGPRRPSAILIENVVGFATSHGGKDLRAVIKRLNDLGYTCDLFSIDARRFVAQSRPRVFIVGSRRRPPAASLGSWIDSPVRPAWISGFVQANPDLRMRPFALPELPTSTATLGDVVERLPSASPLWWSGDRRVRFLDTVPLLHRKRLEQMAKSHRKVWATAYRRTRLGRTVWEIRPDAIAGCLRTTRGGSSKQVLVEACRGEVRMRWMTATEYARLQGFNDFVFDREREGEAMFALGDAVCIPVISWIAREYLAPLFGAKSVSAAAVGTQPTLGLSA